jgi:DNA-binding response OmpR family regulator
VDQERVVLLVEDDPADAHLVQRAFKKAGLEVPMFRLGNGDDAVAYLNGDPPYENRAAFPMPAVILLDIKLPRRSGLEVLQWVRSRKNAVRRIPVVIFTSSRHVSDINTAYESGANSYLAKPETSSQLLAIAEAFKTYWIQLNEQPTLHQAV